MTKWFADIRLTNAAGKAAYVGLAIDNGDLVEATNTIQAWKFATQTFTQLNVSLERIDSRRPRGRRYIPIEDFGAMRLALFEYLHQSVEDIE